MSAEPSTQGEVDTCSGVGWWVALTSGCCASGHRMLKASLTTACFMLRSPTVVADRDGDALTYAGMKEEHRQIQM